MSGESWPRDSPRSTPLAWVGSHWKLDAPPQKTPCCGVVPGTCPPTAATLARRGGGCTGRAVPPLTSLSNPAELSRQDQAQLPAQPPLALRCPCGAWVSEPPAPGCAASREQPPELSEPQPSACWPRRSSPSRHSQRVLPARQLPPWRAESCSSSPADLPFLPSHTCPPQAPLGTASQAPAPPAPCPAAPAKQTLVGVGGPGAGEGMCVGEAPRSSTSAGSQQKGQIRAELSYQP